MKFSKKQIEDFIKKIHSGEINEHDLPEDLYHAIADYLKQGIYEGYGVNFNKLTKEINQKIATDFDSSDLDLLSELRENIYMFSAAKTFQQTKEMTEKLVDENGTVRSFSDFKKDAEDIFKTYNKDWLKSEHTTAIGQSQSAVKWNSIEKQKDILPILVYDTIGDACDICEPLNGITAKVDDPIWNTIMPLNHFNCRCILQQSAEADLTPDDEKESSFNSATKNMNAVFKMNAGKDGYVFNKDHPYFSVSKDEKGFAQKNFNLPIPKKD
ncbi:MAG: phage head morphogenesis protein [Bacteroidota bacterium]|nr:phage head morphogenesis protein [Bacteroidota bacterium]